MSLPVTLYSADGQTVIVYTEGRVGAMLASGRWFATAVEAGQAAAPAAPEPQPVKGKRPAKESL